MQVNAGHNLRSKLLHNNVDWQVAVSTSSADDEDAHDVMNSTKPKAITYFQLSVANHCVPSCVSVSSMEGINENWLILFTRYQPGIVGGGFELHFFVSTIYIAPLWGNHSEALPKLERSLGEKIVWMLRFGKSGEDQEGRPFQVEGPTTEKARL